MVAKDIILTAGHCKLWFKEIDIDRHDFANSTDQYESFQATNILVHPLFEPATYRNDYMLIQIDRPYEQTTPVQLNNNPSIPAEGNSLTVLGWGTTDNSDATSLQFPSILQQGLLTYITNDECEATTVNSKRLYEDEIFPEMLCATSFTGVDACSGDSGGALVIEGKSEGYDLLVGLVSWGRGCAIYPGVYSRISAAYDWIRQEICYMSVDPPTYLNCGYSERAIQYRPTTSPSKTQPIATPVQSMPSSRSSHPEQSRTAPQASPMILIPEYFLTVEIQLDSNSSETGWSLVSEQGQKLLERLPGTYNNQSNVLIFEEIELAANSKFIFEITDSVGDGICCVPGSVEGWFRLSLKQVRMGQSKTNANVLHVVIGNGDFGNSFQRTITTFDQDWYNQEPALSPTNDIQNQAINSSSSRKNIDKYEAGSSMESSVSCWKIASVVHIISFVVAALNLYP